MWIGYNAVSTCSSSNHIFSWTDGSTSTYTNWYTGQPSAGITTSLSECCAAIWSGTGFNGNWNDVTCANGVQLSIYGLCELSLGMYFYTVIILFVIILLPLPIILFANYFYISAHIVSYKKAVLQAHWKTEIRRLET
jgi:hypothetical protein